MILPFERPDTRISSRTPVYNQRLRHFVGTGRSGSFWRTSMPAFIGNY